MKRTYIFLTALALAGCVKEGAPAQSQTQSNTVPVIPAATVAEVTEPESTTGLFDVTTTLPIPDTTYQIIYTPNPNNNNSTTQNNTTTTTPVTTTQKQEEPTDNSSVEIEDNYDI